MHGGETVSPGALFGNPVFSTRGKRELRIRRRDYRLWSAAAEACLLEHFPMC
jgi:hypothetical protein